ncbi:cytochrome ubiquinol oxidase subunit I [Myceligenerans pegani]|uniref:Cytochrome ubiquinol oxidase subunit I n=1 Tax=Myceligenerans pegani TaxID=2776917 RepID=A0ABR9N2D8_9MICO|nr:cytochrome ubiquinol oxidase subunit I [Myceligenerans sp. TRM 65318]MBE1877812.1 cytochrome ubiquinol oxidase subunit I [Myceligenerans sp. TRM 65318]MBE3020083.1 cytochrome ubiquinol oxidase subunit I [Myceligenerans sp. TRM 65318]
MSAADLARLEFALLAAVHFLFVLVTLGLGPVVAVFSSRWARAERRGLWQAPVLERATRFWGQLYLVNYALGIAAGIVLELQFGLHFPGLLDVAGEVFGAPLAIETLGAFFLESTLLGLWVFGWHVIPRRAHALIFWGVVATGYVSAFTVMIANGFLRNPVGHELVDTPDGPVATISDPLALVLNPAAVLSGFHVVGACLMAGGFLLVAVGAWHLRRGGGAGGPWGGRQPADIDEDLWRRSMRTGIVTGSIGALLATGFGYGQFAYITRLDDPGPSGGDVDGPLDIVAAMGLGLMDTVANLVVLVGIVLLLMLIGNGIFRMRRGVRNALYGILIALLPVPFVTAVSGWLTRELSRQPWVVAGVLRTDEAVSDQPAGAVLASLLVLVGLMVTLAVVDWSVLAKLAGRGGDRLVLGAPPDEVLGAETDGDPDADLLRFADAPAGVGPPAGPGSSSAVAAPSGATRPSGVGPSPELAQSSGPAVRPAPTDPTTPEGAR